MNRHFQPPKIDQIDSTDTTPLPRRGYGRIDHIEWQGEESSKFLISIDIVDADWLDMVGTADPRLSIRNPIANQAIWINPEKTSEKSKFINPFEQAPIFTIEVEISAHQKFFELTPPPPPPNSQYSAILAGLERQWLDLNILPSGSKTGMPAAIYSTLFSAPRIINLTGKKSKRITAKSLSSIFSLAHLPRITTTGLEALLKSICKPDLLAVYDVGQGNANALLGRIKNQPSLYYDLGAGVYRNRNTRPADLRFCFDSHQTIILSHWDSDHWAGARASTYTGPHEPMNATWVAPLQTVTPKHTAFAYSIIQAGGNIFIYSPPKGAIGTTIAGRTTIVKFCVGTGSDKNGSGIVLAVERDVLPIGKASWLLTGDCEYGYFLPALNPATSTAIVVPHHGATPHGRSRPPAPAPNYRRLVYSFGPDNKHGSSSVRHPTSSAVTAHIAAGWTQKHWSPATPGCPLPGGDTFATCEHPLGTYRGGVLIAWWARPKLFACTCNHKCNAPLTQT